MTITQLIQSSPANANELFAKLTTTSDGAVKTRESLFNELKAELELHSRLEEEHLFPALRKHKETKDIVRAAMNDNKQARALIAELDAIPKSAEEFLAKLEELRKVFQQHVRDEKKELLPAVRAALSNEEAQAITERVEAERAAVEDAKKRESEERRAAARAERDEAERRRLQAEARRQRAREEEKRKQAEIRAEELRKQEQAERRRAQAEARKQRAREEEKRQQAELRAEQRRLRQEELRVQEEAEAEKRRLREAGRAMARTGIGFFESGQSAGVAAAQASADGALTTSREVAAALTETVGQTGSVVSSVVQKYSDRVQPAVESMEALASVPPAVASAAAETGKTWFELMGRTAESSGRRSRNLLQCFTPQQAAEVQGRYWRETGEAWFEANARMLDISIETYRTVMRLRRGSEDRGEEHGRAA